MTRAAAFWASAAGATWILVGYPAALRLRPARGWQRSETLLPRVTVVVPAYRERDGLRRKLEALRGLDYPSDLLQVVVAVDEDVELVRVAETAAPSATVTFSPRRGGKAVALNRAAAHIDGEVVLLTDANNVLQRGSLRAAVRHFADPAVWAVAGRRGEHGSAYDRYEDAIRRLESRTGSVAAASGEFMAVRRERLPQFPADVVNEDFWLLCRLVRDGGRVVYEPAASSSEDSLALHAERARRSRMGAGRVMLLSELRGLPAGFAVRVTSHKYGRLALPFLLAAAMASSVALARRPGYAACAMLQLTAYGLGGLELAGRAPGGPAGRLARACAQFVHGNAAVAIGVVRGLRGRQTVRWEPVA